MKNVLKTSVVFAMFLGIALFATSKMVNTAPDTTLPLKEQAMKVFSDGGCITCHTQAPEAPWYGSLPGMKGKFNKTAAKGVRHIDLNFAFDRLDSPAGMSLPDLLRIERAIDDGTMPSFGFGLAHWKAPVTAKKTAALKEWIADYRRTFYPNGNAPQFADEPICVIPDKSPLPVDPAKAALGEKLFNDTRLSLDNTLSCASCHLLEKYGVDNEQVSDGVAGAVGTVNAPTVFNSVFNFVQFWDGRAETLAQQAAGPPVNPVEMASESFDQIIAKLTADKAFMKEFGMVYSEVTEATITDAIEHYERTLITPNGRFDRYLKGETDAIDADELAGYALFKEHNCSGCHSGVIAGGQSYEFMGLKNDYFAERVSEEIVDDNGHFSVTGNPYDLHRFKVPGLRNVAHTWPYFHDGTRNTLEEAVSDMAWYQNGIKLSESDVAKITAFLKTL